MVRIGVPAVSTKVTETLTVEVPSAGTVPLAGDSVTADAVDSVGAAEAIVAVWTMTRLESVVSVTRRRVTPQSGRRR